MTTGGASKFCVFTSIHGESACWGSGNLHCDAPEVATLVREREDEVGYWYA